MSEHRLEIPFEQEGRRGSVVVSCVPSRGPVSIGKSEKHVGFPACTATVTLDTEGYAAFCGWVQLVRSGDNASGGREFEIDPLDPFTDSPSPFCFFGLAPTLFDAPSRERRAKLSWIANSFLAEIDLIEERRGVRPLLGFEWGFEISPEGLVGLHAPARLGYSAWNAHLPILRQTYPTWSFGDAPDSQQS